MSGEYAAIEEEAAPEGREEPTREAKFWYWFDNFFATDPMAKVYLLCFVNVLFMTVFAICFHISGSQGGDWAENFWMGFTFAADMAEDDHGGGFPYWQEWIFRLMNFSFSFGGAFVFGMVINFLSSAIDDRVSGLRKGKSKVIEQGHSLILGWNDRVLSLTDQLCQANISEGGLPIVILAEEDKEGMDDFFMDALDKEARFGSKIVTRQGSMIEPLQLLKVAAPFARSIIVLSVGDDADEADAQAVRVVLACTGGLESLDKPIRCHITIELQDVDNADVAMLGVADESKREDTVIPVVSHDIIGKLMIQCAREIGLSQCFANLLCFDGSECYFSPWNAGEGHHDDGMTRKSFMDTCYRFADAAAIGVRFCNVDDPAVRAINPAGRPVMLNPPGDYIMQAGDKILVLAEDNDTYSYGPSNNPEKTPVPPYELPPAFPEKILLAGWRRDFDDLIMELDKWVPPNSSLTLLNIKSVEDQEAELARAGCDIRSLTNISTVELVCADPCNGSQLERLGPQVDEDDNPDRILEASYRIEQYNMVLTLCEEGKSGGLSADSRVMVSMLIMRHIEETRSKKSGIQGIEKILVAEILDPRTLDLMSLTKASDSVVGNQLVAMILAQISEDRDIGYVMEDLFSEEGMEMHIKDIRLFVGPNELLNWWELIGRCMQRNMLPMGWIRKTLNDAGEIETECIINPPNKDERLIWNGEDGAMCDKLIVVSED
jgi:hypothetical protein